MFSKKLLRKASLVRRFQTSVRCSEKELCKFWSQNPQDPQSSVTATQIPCLFVLGRSSATACRSKLSVRQTWVQKKWNDSNDSSPKWIYVDRYIYIIHILYIYYILYMSLLEFSLLYLASTCCFCELRRIGRIWHLCSSPRPVIWATVNAKCAEKMDRWFTYGLW
jgi:hypothetical protein